LDVSRTAFEILTHKARKQLVFPTPPLFDAPLKESPSKFLDETYREQESLANAMQVSARQPCVYEDLLYEDRCLTPPPEERTPCDINAIYTSLKRTFSGLQFRP